MLWEVVDMFTRKYVSWAAMVGVLASAQLAAAHSDSRECKPSGSPNSLGQTGEVAVAQPVEYWSKPWLLVADKQAKPDKVRLVSASGDIVEIAKPPITVEPVKWLARGRAVYALSKGRSQTPGKTDVVLMRWGQDPRPRLINIRTGITLEGELGAVFSNEFLALSWAERAADGSLHRMLATMDAEDIKVAEPKDLGVDDGSTLGMQAENKQFVVLWTSKKGLMRASFDQFGKASGAALTSAFSEADKDSGSTLAALPCGERSWLVRQNGKELSVSYSDASGVLKELTRLPLAPDATLLPTQCVEGSIVIGRRTLDAKASSVTLWVTTIDQAGKVHDRRLKDLHGSADALRLAQFSRVGDKLTSWWIEGSGGEAKVWSRELSCK
jgi:hypothetical protein